MHVRLAHPDDGPAIRRIYNTEVTGSQLNFDIIQWTASDQDAWLARHRGAYPAVVASTSAEELDHPRPAPAPGPGPGPAPGPGPRAHEVGEADPGPSAGAHGELVLGFGSLSRFRTRPAYATSVEDSLYVDRQVRGLGVGRAILTELVRLAGEHGFHTVVARVVGHNEPSIALHQACGFQIVGVEREVGRKHGQWLDVMELQLLL